MTDYEIEYQRHESACGEPFREIVEFFHEYRKSRATVLDLGCGQSRDALMNGPESRSTSYPALAEFDGNSSPGGSLSFRTRLEQHARYARVYFINPFPGQMVAEHQ